jgi:hypothetical protein
MSIDISSNTISALSFLRISSSVPLYTHIFSLLGFSFISCIKSFADRSPLVFFTQFHMLSSFFTLVLATKLSEAIKIPTAPYSHVGCWAEPGNIRALTDVIYTSDAMTLEYCDNSYADIYGHRDVKYGREVDSSLLDAFDYLLMLEVLLRQYIASWVIRSFRRRVQFSRRGLLHLLAALIFDKF